MNEILFLEKKKLLEEIKKNDWAFMKAPKELLADREFMIESAKKMAELWSLPQMN